MRGSNRLPLAIIAALSLATPAAAMDADTFYTKGVALQKRGMAAMFSSDLKLLRAEIDAASKAVKAENASAKSAGKPLYCPPPHRTSCWSSWRPCSGTTASR